ncbi:uncharacterized protein FMAN_08278 [Fusarium mangiferae]|uniref:Uncharacterized protein n=1 Tax=Fusarium mangiferae TaxID=192010 RepID=A0A1L7TZ74_FUSMA|nr:uncharacterized protein FMAN_08278 [Fusarium mangiferae]CVL02202.1 uncharacterized protein FMAN_08278 [Fusarium mangiferae]
MSEITEIHFTHNDYTVAWICALPTEQTAAILMLDKEHSSLPSQCEDPNTYTLGSVGNHNVVIACLPLGQTGNDPAASVVMALMMSFPAVRFGLMVGIGGGGLSSKVRLGDVVVSKPVDDLPGVIQWDKGRAEQSGSFRRTGSLNNPPRVLLTALTKLISHHDRNGNGIQLALENVRATNPKLSKSYTGRDGLKDIKFDVDYPHQERPADDSASELTDEEEDACRFCDKSRAVEKKPRETKIHYGLIASGNKVVKDSVLRNSFRKEFGNKLLCFEMEAAGIMNSLPCLVIRGICDYADSHKSDGWQKYAAMVAAIFAKELLLVVHAEEVKQMKDVKDLQKTMETTQRTVLEDKYQKILSWLREDDQGNRLSQHLGQRQAGTGQWLLVSPEFNQWLKYKPQMLFCRGAPGVGKTIIASVVVEELTKRYQGNNEIGIAYVFCEFTNNEEHPIEPILRAFIKQLSQIGLPFPAAVESLYHRTFSLGRVPTVDDLLDTLVSLLNLYSKVYIIIDALDEFSVSGGRRTKFMKIINDLRNQPRLNFLVTSRYIPEISDSFSDYVDLAVETGDEDIEKYLNGYLPNLDGVVGTDKELQKEAKCAIIKAASGMFLLAKLQAEQLGGMINPKLARSKFEQFCLSPGSYEEAYKGALDRIRGQSDQLAELAIRTLSWVTHMERSISIQELQIALAVEKGNMNIDPHNFTSAKLIITSCAGLIMLDNRKYVQIAHYTAQEFLRGGGGIRLGSPHREIATSCIASLCSNYICMCMLSSSKFCVSHKIPNGVIEEDFKSCGVGDTPLCSFSRYVRYQWVHHARKAYTEVKELILEIIKDEQNFHKLARYLRDYRDWRTPKLSALHLAVHWNFPELVSDLIKLGHNPASKDAYGRTPLSWAAGKGLENLVVILLAADSTVANARSEVLWGEWVYDSGRDYWDMDRYRDRYRGPKGYNALKWQRDVSKRGATPLWYAAYDGHSGVVRKLLAEPSVDPNLADEAWGVTPFLAATALGHVGVVKAFIEHDGGSPMEVRAANIIAPHAAVIFWHHRVLSLLLTEGWDPNSRDPDGETPLRLAIQLSNNKAVKLLMNQPGIENDATGRDGMQAFHGAMHSKTGDFIEPSLPKRAISWQVSNSWFEIHLSYWQ